MIVAEHFLAASLLTMLLPIGLLVIILAYWWFLLRGAPR